MSAIIDKLQKMHQMQLKGYKMTLSEARLLLNEIYDSPEYWDDSGLSRNREMVINVAQHLNQAIVEYQEQQPVIEPVAAKPNRSDVIRELLFDDDLPASDRQALVQELNGIVFPADDEDDSAGFVI